MQITIYPYFADTVSYLNLHVPLNYISLYCSVAWPVFWIELHRGFWLQKIFRPICGVFHPTNVRVSRKSKVSDHSDTYSGFFHSPSSFAGWCHTETRFMQLCCTYVCVHNAFNCVVPSKFLILS